MRDFVGGDVIAAASHDCEVSKLFRGYTELAVRRATNVARLTQECMKGIPTLVAPSLTRPGHDELLYLYIHEGQYDASDEGYDVRLQKTFKLQMPTCLLAVKDNTWAEHKKVEFERQCRLGTKADWTKAVQQEVASF